MLTIKDLSGNDLVATPPADQTVIGSVGGGAQVAVSVLVEENDTTLPHAYVNGTLNWHDGSQPITYFGTGTLAISEKKNLLPGDYFISVVADNYRAPEADTVGINYYVKVIASDAQIAPANILVGPILPKDSGFPGPDNWNFPLSTDIAVLASSLKMLLLTSRGERVMLPEYGTDLRRLLFQQNTQGIENLAQQEIVDAVTKWEPRVQLIGISVDRTNDTTVTIEASFLSKLDQTGFNLSLTYQQ